VSNRTIYLFSSSFLLSLPTLAGACLRITPSMKVNLIGARCAELIAQLFVMHSLTARLSSLWVYLGNKLGVRRRRNSLGQSDRGGGGPAVHAAEGNAGPVSFSSGLRAR
jgi:hypothetical protein